MKIIKNIYGFSYIELVISVAILALLATAATPYLEKRVKREKEAELRHSLRVIRTAIDQYKKAYDEGRMTKIMGASGYPETLETLVVGVPDAKDPNKRKLRFIRRIPFDPMYIGEETVASATWGKRSYQSDAENPQEGVDVFDIYSLSEEKGLNGTPYREW